MLETVYFRQLALSMIVVVLADLVCWNMDGAVSAHARVILYLSNMIYLTSQMVTVSHWLDFASFMVRGRILDFKKQLILCWIPTLIITALALTTPWTGLMFSLDSSNHYMRGPLSTVAAFAVLIGLLGVSCWILKRRDREVRFDRRVRYLSLAMFSVLPGIGAVFQTLLYGVSLIWPLAAIAMLQMYITLVQQEISRDSLTGLNNRRNLDAYLNEQVIPNTAVTWDLLLLDINSFKEINDQYGHERGDRILREVADAMKRVYSFNGTFLARYGGDEFVIIMAGVSADKFRRTLGKFGDAMIRLSKKYPDMPQISVSVGHAFYPDDGISSAMELLNRADMDMYKNKREFHRLAF